MRMLKSPPEFVAHTTRDDVSSQFLVTLYFHGSELLVSADGANAAEAGIAVESGAEIVIGTLNQTTYRAINLSERPEPPEGAKFAGLRSLFGVMPDATVAIAGRAAQLLRWDRTHQFCGVCATPTVREGHERSRKCPACGHSAYPRISPAMMCLVTRGKEILLARNVSFPAGRYSALAGFLEAGESVEDAVHREVREEVGVAVKNLRYFDSQSWPFPDSLMIAFTAEYAGGELKPNGVEIAEADWFSKEALPQMPPSASIARALIDDTLARLAA
jgi:NAD+ diphosphatase